MTDRPRSRARLIASSDRTLPTTHVGVLEANYFCRGWNAKRQKYCGSRAGAKTSHPGLGRCNVHGGLGKSGDRRVKSGRTSRTKRESLRDLILAEQQRTDPLDLSHELATLRALVIDLRVRANDIDRAAELELAESIGRMVERIERIRSQNAISRPELNRVMNELWRSVEVRVIDADVKAAIREDWMAIAL